MITINKQFNISGVVAPYTYTFGSNNSTVTFSNQSGSTSTSTLATDIRYPDEATIGLSTVSLTITDKNGCSTTQNVTVTNPCETLAFTGYAVSGYTFNPIVTSPGCNKVNFTYSYDPGVLTLDSQSDSAFSSQARFKPVKGRVLPNSTVVSVTAENCQGCLETRLVSMNILSPRITVSNNMIISCPDDVSLYGAYILVDKNSDSTDLNWDTLDIGFGGSNNWGNSTVTTITESGVKRGFIHLAQSQVPIAETTYFRVYVEDIYGQSTSWDGILKTEACSSVGNIPATSQIVPKNVNVASTLVSGDNVEIDVTYSVASLLNPDWSTAQVLTSPAYSSPSIEFRTTPDLRQVIDYEYTGASDLFAWTVDDINGNTLPPSTVSISVLPAAPVANTDNFAMVSGDTEIFDVLSNDTSSVGLNVGSVRVTQQSTTGGIATANSDGTITYVSDVTDFGSALIRYKVNDIYGQESNAGGVVITRISAGNDYTQALCATSAQSVIVNLFNLLTLGGERPLTPGGTWSNLGTASPSPTAPVLYSNDITFTQGTHAAGTHTYRYTVISGSATDTRDVEIEFQTYAVPSNNECAGATVISFGGRGTTGTVSDQDLAASCPGFAAATYSATATPTAWGASSYVSDVWYTFTATPYYDTISMTYVDYPILIGVNGANYGVDEGMFATAVAVYDGTCGALVERSANVANVSNQNISTQVVMSGSSAKTYFVRVSAISGYEGKYSVNLTA